MFSAFKNMFWGSSEPQLPSPVSGVLYCAPTNAQDDWHRVYSAATLEIEKVGDKAFNLVARCDTSRPDVITMNNVAPFLSFKVGGVLNIRLTGREDVIWWKDSVLGVPSIFRFEVSPGIQTTAFIDYLGRAVYMVCNNKEPSGADATHEGVLALFKYSKEETKTASPAAASSGSCTVPPPLAIKGLDGKTIVNAPCVLLVFNFATGLFDVQKEKAFAVIKELDKFRFGLIVLDASEGEIDAAKHAVIAQPINNKMQPYFSSERRSITWTYATAGKVWTWAIMFADAGQDAVFKDAFSKCLYESTKKQLFEKASKEDQSSLLETMRDDSERFVDAIGQESEEEKEDDDDEEESLLEAMDKLSLSSSSRKEDDEMEHDPVCGIYRGDSTQDDDDSDEDEEDDEYVRKIHYLRDLPGSKNRLLSVSNTHGRVFVSRGSQLGVFTAPRTEKMSLDSVIPSVVDENKKRFIPRRMQLHHSDTQMLFLQPHNSHSVVRMDLETGSVVDEWSVGTFPANEIAPLPDGCVTAVNRVGFFVLDERLSGKTKVVDSRSCFSQAGRAPGFSCAVLTPDGKLAVGTEGGEIKLYPSKMLSPEGSGRGGDDDLLSRSPRAKTSFSGFGDPILGIDVTRDGEWIVATCKTYLLLIRTVDKKGRSGFDYALGKEKLPPRRLQVNPGHLHAMGGHVSYTLAKFNKGEGRETTIVTSSGDYVVTWSFLAAKQNRLRHYKITKAGGIVVADQFLYGDADSIVVALPDDVTIAKKKTNPKKK